MRFNQYLSILITLTFARAGTLLESTFRARTKNQRRKAMRRDTPNSFQHFTVRGFLSEGEPAQDNSPSCPHHLYLAVGNNAAGFASDQAW